MSARSREAFTEVSSLVSSIEPETIEADICCPVRVKSISEESETVTSHVFVPERLPSLVISEAVTNLFVVAVSLMSSVSRTTTPVCQFTESTAPPPPPVIHSVSKSLLLALTNI